MTASASRALALLVLAPFAVRRHWPPASAVLATLLIGLFLKSTWPTMVSRVMFWIASRTDLRSNGSPAVLSACRPTSHSACT